ncbi:MAG: hypothetical protein IJ087_10255, partial [Eggerthellaceae bacterium]|nr:hypothetical protein [Eggerthellaceae bacterium]
YRFDELLSFFRVRALEGVEIVDGASYARAARIDSPSGTTLHEFLAANPDKTYHAFAQNYLEDGEQMTSPRRPAQVAVTPELAASGDLESYSAEPVFDANGNFIRVPTKDSPAYDWSVPEAQRFNRAYELEESNVLPLPVGGVEGQEYKYNADATTAIKRELYAGRGVSVSLFDDSETRTDDDGNSRFTNRETWSQYTRSDEGKVYGSAHITCIVGWDDTWSKENFAVGGKTPPADGAWIVKNSYGSENAAFPNKGTNGALDKDGKHTGYLYVSYYDMSLSNPESFDYDVTGHVSDVINQYDLMPSPVAHTEKFTGEVSCANVFTAGKDQVARALSVETEVPDTKVKLELYELADGATSPTDGTRVATVEKTFTWGGYHRIAIDNPVMLAHGKRFAVVATLTAQADGKTTYHVPVHRDVNQSSIEKYGDKVTSYVKGVVNPGESFLLKDGAWVDWSSQIVAGKEEGSQIAAELGDRFDKEFDTELAKHEGALNPYYDFDNFSLKVFADNEGGSVEGAALALSAGMFVFNWQVQRPVVKTVGGQELVEGVDFTVGWPESKNAGTYTVRAVGIGDYEGTSAEATYRIVRANNPPRGDW